MYMLVIAKWMRLKLMIVDFVIKGINLAPLRISLSNSLHYNVDTSCYLLHLHR